MNYYTWGLIYTAIHVSQIKVELNIFIKCRSDRLFLFDKSNVT